MHTGSERIQRTSIRYLALISAVVGLALPAHAAPDLPAQDASTPEAAPAEEASFDAGASNLQTAEPLVAPDVGHKPAPTDADDAGVEPAAEPAQEASNRADARDDAMFGTDSELRPASREKSLLEDPLSIGGQLYLNAQATALKGQKVKDFHFESPSLLDLYLDARIGERVRAFSLFRVGYTAFGNDDGRPTTIGAMPVPSSHGLRYGLDQMWMSFDAYRTLFLTVGKVHDRWGVGRVWTPSDFLHVLPRDPLAIIDTRPGTGMIKLHLPVESLAWNLYAYTILDGPDLATTLSRVAGAVRAQFVVGPAELAVGALARRNEKVIGAADVSVGIGRLDVYAEVALRDSTTVDRVRFDPSANLPPLDPAMRPDWLSPQAFEAQHTAELVESAFPRYRKPGYAPQAVVGAVLNLKYGNNDTLNLGAEYFFNDLGYAATSAYPGLVLARSTPLTNAAPFFYIGRHYAALTVSLPAPGSWNRHSFSLSTIGNLSDHSFVSRLNYTVLILAHVELDAYAALRYGRRTGEFRAGGSVDLGGERISQEPTLLDLGIALRLAL